MDYLKQYEEIKAKNLKIDATRGKPNTQQVALCNDMLNAPLKSFQAEDGTDVRNYGGNDGIPEIKRLFADLLGVDTKEVIVGGNSSLNMMFDCVATMVLAGQWTAQPLSADKTRHEARDVKFICPAPGYDRHFAICEYFGIKMLTVPMTPTGPDMNEVEKLAQDPDVVGMWCVPVFSNPQGYIYSDDTIRRLASMQTAHPHFRILWDDAYTIHHFTGERPTPLNILTESRKAGNESRPIMFTSFSKISIAGAGIVCLAAAGDALATLRKRFSAQTIGPDKTNQLRHAQYFKTVADIQAHMQKHAAILHPKFELAISTFAKKLPPPATFTTPNGGYFISVEIPNQAKRVRQLCKDAGVLITEAGATFPYNTDPNNSNLRFAPSFLSMEDLEIAVEVFCLAVQIAVNEVGA
ncbi:MAG: aminotransferase class I/II-fold pyridoxal phosphate-dependent enzyme [Defluviitaleaceae bacterium]|nr:aminotransferase class I/II-fold pyridoxal phosphate-dependent enzyme [Defluviitaleaceae bacterium]